MQENITTIAPPNTSEDQFDMNWEEIDSTVQAFPVEYLLKVLVQQKEIANEVDSEKPATPAIPLVCHRVKVQRYYICLFVPLTRIRHASYIHTCTAWMGK